MKLTKILLSTLSAALLALTFSCSSAQNVNLSVNVNKSNTATITNSNQTAVNKSTPASTATPPVNKTSASPTAEKSGDTQKISGELQNGKTESLILYVGMETGDYAAYCFDNDSDAGRAISAACKQGDRCEVNGEVAPGKCTVPGLEASLSDSGRIVKVTSVKSLGPAKKGK